MDHLSKHISIRSLIQAAEHATPRQDLQVEVLCQAAPEADPNQANYLRVRAQLATTHRETLDRDYQLYALVAGLVAEIKAKVVESRQGDLSGTRSPLQKRLQWILVRPPVQWRVCSYCNGSGQGDIGYCRGCEGFGYAL